MNAFFNTTHETDKLPEYEVKASEQNETVLAIFQRMRMALSPSQVLAYYPLPPGALLPPLTSIRRAITTLTKAGALVKLESKRKGLYGRLEGEWVSAEYAASRQAAESES